NFAVDVFLDAIPLLLSSETKSVVSATLSVLEKLAKLHAGKREAITIGLCQAFIVSDDAIQTRASKIIAKYATPSLEMTEAIGHYQDSLLANARKNLEPLMPVATFITETATPDENQPHVNE